MRKTWKESGFDDFSKGTFQNGGQNLYVSKKGRLQRIFRYDFNQDGYADVAFANSQDMGERPDVTLVQDPLHDKKTVCLPTQGVFAGCSADLSGDGNDDLVLAHQNNGTHTDLPAYVYYADDNGIHGQYRIELYAPNATDVDTGDFQKMGKNDVVFASCGKLRIFKNGESGLIEHGYIDGEVPGYAVFIATGDLDNDGYDDLVVRMAQGELYIIWGSSEGLDMSKAFRTDFTVEAMSLNVSTTEARYPWPNTWRPRIVCINDKPLLFVPNDGKVHFYAIENRRLVLDRTLDVSHAIYALVADINNNGFEDLFLCVCHHIDQQEQSLLFPGTKTGIDWENPVAVPTKSARSAVACDIDGDGCNELVIACGNDGISYSVKTPIYRIEQNRPVYIADVEVHDATDVLVVNSRNAMQLAYMNRESGRVRGDVPFYVYYNSKSGFSEDRRDELSTWAGTDTICCDFFDRGIHDLLLANCAENSVRQGIDPGSFLFTGSKEGFRDERRVVFPTLRAHGCAVGDFRKSGYLDIAFGGFCNPCITIWQGTEHGYDLDHPVNIVLDDALPADFRAKHPSDSDYEAYAKSMNPQKSEVRFLLAADVNKNGYLDLLVSQIAGDCFMILWGGPKGFSAERMTRLPVVNSVCSQVADLNGNGWPDLIVGGYTDSSKTWTKDSVVTIFWGSEHGFDKTRCTQLPGHGCNSLTVADFNKDGFLDIFVTSYNGGRDRDLDAYLYWGSAEGVYSEKNRKRFFTHSSCGCLALDFNNDGYVDLAVSNHKTYGNHKGYSQIWYNGPNGFSEQAITWLKTNGPHGLMAVDAGNIMDRSEEEVYTSAIHDAHTRSVIRSLDYACECPPMTWVHVQLKAADSKEELESKPWHGAGGAHTVFTNPQTVDDDRLCGRYMQYRLLLGAKNGGNSPVITKVQIEYEDGK